MLEVRVGSSLSPTVKCERLEVGEMGIIKHLPSMECQVTCNLAVNIDYFLL